MTTRSLIAATGTALLLTGGLAACSSNDDSSDRNTLGSGVHAVSLPSDARMWADRSAGQCEDVSPGTIVGIIAAHTGYNAAGDDGLDLGYAGMPAPVWAQFGAEVDDDGNVVGQPGSGDPKNLADATMAVGKQYCDSLDTAKSLQATAGGVDTETLALSIVTAGEQYVRDHGALSTDCDTADGVPGSCSALIGEYADEVDTPSETDPIM
jgi:hypothetical protein